ncbi:MAG: porin family protein [Rikenellaceae bacterium]|nr:porin family protein [Rikenellaceae bacterium]
MMKRLIMLALAAILLMTASTLKAQNLNVQWGITAGVNMADYSVKALKGQSISYDKVKNDLGWQVGLMASVNIGRLAIEPQILYVRHSTELTHGTTKNALKSNSLDVPLLVSFRLIGPLRVMAGPVFTVLNDNTGLKDLSIDQLRSTCSYALGVEARILQKLRLDVRYNGQFKKKETIIGEVGVNTFALNIGYYF